VATLLGALVLLSAASVWSLPNPVFSSSTWSILLTVCLMVAVVLTYAFPIYIRHNLKVCVFSIPLFLLAALLPPALAGCAALLALLGGELSVHSQRGTYPSDIATNVGRWTVIVLMGSLVAHLHIPVSDLVIRDLLLLTVAALMWVGDLLTLPLVLYPISGEHPIRLILGTVRESGLVEATQYGVAVIGVLLAMQQVWTLAMLVVPAGLVYLAFRKEVDADTFRVLESMADTIDLRDPYTVEHSRRVAKLVADILHELGMHGQEAKQIITAARIHDLGKVSLPEGLLIKEEALTPEEQALLESYPEQGAELLAVYPDFSRGIGMVRHHHERWDGTGYPAKLEGADIPFGARVIAVADSFDAMTSERPYRRALMVEQAAQILRDGRGRQWDGQIVDALLRSIGDPLEHAPIPSQMRNGADGPLAASQGVPA
jgi:HD-GYP domain-containing protein (c-di-GMP phosphodiesterase class II)